MLRENIVTNQNHPSVLLWSIGNELAVPTTPAEAAYIAAAAAVVHSLDPTRPAAMAISAWPGLACQTAYAPVEALGFNDYFGWFDAGGGATDDRDALGPFLDSLRACYPTKGLFVTEFGFDANRNGPVEERGTYQFQANSAAYHLSVFAQKQWLAGASYFTLQEYAAGLGYTGGNPWPDPPFNQKGLVDLYGNLKPAFATVSAIYHATRQLGPPSAARARRPIAPARGATRTRHPLG
jgi:beta-glucuronidase